MEQIKGIRTELGIIQGRDAIYLDKITFNGETEMHLTGELNAGEKTIKFIMTFKGIRFLSIVELDFDKRGPMESLATIEQSEKLNEFKRTDHSRKINDNHKHYYIRTYDQVFEIICDQFELIIQI